MTLDEYVAWAAGIGAGRLAGEPDQRALHENALGFASEVGEVAGVLAKWLRDGTLARDRLADELGDVAYYWARLSVVTGLAPSILLARSRAHVEWRSPRVQTVIQHLREIEVAVRVLAEMLSRDVAHGRRDPGARRRKRSPGRSSHA